MIYIQLGCFSSRFGDTAVYRSERKNAVEMCSCENFVRQINTKWHNAERLTLHQSPCYHSIFGKFHNNLAEIYGDIYGESREALRFLPEYCANRTMKFISNLY